MAILRRLRSIAPYAPLVAWTCIGLGLLFVVRQSAVSMLARSESASFDSDRATPLADLNSVDAVFRSAGRETLSLHAARFVLLHDMRTITVDGIATGVAYAAGKPALDFSAGHAWFFAPIGNLNDGRLSLARNVSARTVAAGMPVRATTSGLDWRWPNGIVRASGPVVAQVGTLGTVRSATLSIDPKSESATFSGLEAVADASVLPVPQTPSSGASASSSAGATDSGREHIVFDADQQGRWDEQTHTLSIAGPVTVREGAVRMQTVGVVYDKSTNTAKALTPVTIVDEKNTVTGDHGDIDFDTHDATLDGNVHLYATPAKAANSGDTLQTQAHKPTNLNCDHIVYNYRTKLADATGHLTVLQTDRTVTADAGHYDTKAELITLVGHVDGRDKDGKHVTAPAATVSVKEGDEYIEVKGPIEWSFDVGSQDNPLPPGTQSSKPGTPAKPDTPAAAAAPGH
jgi:lipopolysaccharide export system protein LptA